MRPQQIVVVDNSSAIDSRDDRPAIGRDWRWMRAESNLGFGQACNLGARDADSDYLLFLNADLVLQEDACERLVSAAEKHYNIGVVGPRIYGADRRIELSARTFPTMFAGLFGRSSVATKLLTRVGRPPRGVSRALRSTARVDWVSGACMLVRREAFEQVGGFDESYWMYWEDADICYRLKARGWSTMLCTDAQAHHMTGSSGRSPRTIEAFHKSAALYYERNVARVAVTSRLARWLLNLRMKLVLKRHARRPAH
jgi:GT2 family glycosyltransferase